MADEGQGKRRRRGRRRDRKEANNRPEDGAGKDDLSRGDVSGEEITSESDVPDVVDDQPETADEEPEDSGKASRRERTRAGAGGGGVSPMDFWRSGRMRSARERRVGTGPSEPQGFFKRITSIPLPPWVPVVAIILVTFGVLGLLFLARSTSGAPRTGDHWHSPYTIVICGEKQPPIGAFEAGAGSPGTHGDGIMHSHPFQTAGEGSGSNLKNFFRVGGGKLDDDEIQVPGYSETFKNGDECPDGTVGVVQVFVNSQKIDDFKRYIPKDGDQLRIIFGAPEEVTQLDDRTVIADEQATREITIEVSGSESATRFSPSSLDVEAGEAVRVRVRNTAEVSHGFRVSGADGEYGNEDDFVVTPDGHDPETTSGVLLPGEEGTVVIRFDSAGSFEFQDPTAVTTTGTIIVGDVVATETAAPVDDFEVELDVDMLDGAYEPDVLLIDVGTKVKLNLNNLGEFVHNLRIAGPDGEYETEDDILSGDIWPGEVGELIFELGVEGPYIFRDDFSGGTMTGDLIVQ